MNPKIDPCSLNIAQPIAQKGIKSLWQSSERLLSCQGSLIVTIPAVHSAYRYLKVSHRIHFSKSVSIPSLLMNSLIRSKPASDERSSPSKFILICLLLSKANVFTIFIHLIGEKQYSAKIQ